MENPLPNPGANPNMGPTQPKNPFQQVFALRIIKTIDPKTGQENVEFKAQSQGLNIYEAISILRGWCEIEEKKRQGHMFANIAHRQNKPPK